MGEFLGEWFVYLLFVSYVVALVCGQTLTGRAVHAGVPDRGRGRVRRLLVGQIPNAIWWGRPWKSAFKEFVDGIVYALLTAGTFGWLWPR